MQRTLGYYTRRSLPWIALLLVLHGCVTNPPPTNDPDPLPMDDGPPFVINSPADGSQVSGPVFFSVQPFDASAVRNVRFEAAGIEIAPRYAGEDQFKVFLMPREFPDGDLTLTATVTGHDGTQSRRSITVDVVASPPSQAIVTSSGAVLGTLEENGATSVLAIPSGVAEGANVRFDSRSQEQVKQSTGVDYEALGVTFLGAQEITIDRPIERSLMVASGGFGPMVQPGQTVVNYMIMADGDGNGIGELVVESGATVAPNGDVVSDPAPSILVADEALAIEAAGVRRLSDANDSVAPGGVIELAAVGLNGYSGHGNVAVFLSRATNLYATAPASVTADADVGLRTHVVVPNLPPGPATVALVNLSTGAVGPDIALTIAEPPALEGSLLDAFNDYFDTLVESLEKLPGSTDLESATALVVSMKQEIADLLDEELPADVLEPLELAARMLHNTDATTVVRHLTQLLDTECDFPWLLAANAGVSALGLVMPITAIVAAGGLLAFELVQSHRIDPIGGTYTIVESPFAVAREVARRNADGYFPRLNRITSVAARFNGAYTSYRFGEALGEYLLCDPTPPRPNNVPTRGGITGMGSAPPPGGSGAGNVFAGDVPSVDERVASSSASSASLSGRFFVKVYVGGIASAFTGVTDAGGYFFVPFVPVNQPFVAVATDARTGEVRTFEGVGRPTGESVLMHFDFAEDGEGGPELVTLDSMHSRSIEPGANHLYAFDAAIGQVTRFALHTDVANSWPTPLVGMSITSPSGEPFGTTANRSQYTHVHTIWPKAIEETGQHVLAIGNTTETTVQYTLGIVEVDPTIPVAVSAAGASFSGEIAVLHDVDLYGYTSQARSAGKLLIRHPDHSNLEVQVALQDPNGRRTLNPSNGAEARSTVRGPFAMLAAGSYVLEIEAQEGRPTLDNSFGAYEATLFVPPVTPMPLRTNVSGRLEDLRIATYRHETPDTDLMTVAVLASAPTSGTVGNLMVMGTGGGFVTRRIDGSTLKYATFGVLSTTNYPDTVVVETTDEDGFDYQLAVSPVAPVSAALPFAGDRPRLEATGSIDALGEVVSFAFSATAGEQITLALGHPASASLQAEVEVYYVEGTGTQRGTRIGRVHTTQASRSDTLTFTAANTGIILLDVSTVAGNFETVDQILGTFELILEFQ